MKRDLPPEVVLAVAIQKKQKTIDSFKRLTSVIKKKYPDVCLSVILAKVIAENDREHNS